MVSNITRTQGLRRGRAKMRFVVHAIVRKITLDKESTRTRKKRNIHTHTQKKCLTSIAMNYCTMQILCIFCAALYSTSHDEKWKLLKWRNNECRQIRNDDSGSKIKKIRSNWVKDIRWSNWEKIVLQNISKVKRMKIAHRREEKSPRTRHIIEAHRRQL